MQDKTNFYTMEKLLSGILTMVMNTSLTGDDHGSLTAATYGFSLSGTSESLYDATPGYPEITWSDYMQVNSPVETGLFQKIKFIGRLILGQEHFLLHIALGMI